MERVRANLSGASDFLSKPPRAADVMQIVEKYIQSLPLTSAHGQRLRSYHSSNR